MEMKASILSSLHFHDLIKKPFPPIKPFIPGPVKEPNLTGMKMMDKIKVILFTALMVIGFTLSALAQTDGNGLNRNDVRQAAQRARIAEGTATGELSRAEASQLRTRQRQISRVERRAEADGSLTAREAKRINHLQNRASRDIRREKNDAQVRN